MVLPAGIDITITITANFMLLIEDGVIRKKRLDRLVSVMAANARRYQRPTDFTDRIQPM